MERPTNWYYISVYGRDAQRFLQGQIPVNLLHMQTRTATYSCLTLPTGKVIATFRLYKITDYNFFILTYGEESARRIENHLKKFAVFSDIIIKVHSFVEIYLGNDTTTEYKLIGYPNNDYAEHTPYNLQFLITDYRINPEIAKKEFGIEGQIITGEQSLALAALNGFVYNLEEKNCDKFLPQALGIDHLESAISYNKGCYQGQEGIARAKFRGANTHTHVIFTFDGQIAPNFDLEQAQIFAHFSEDSNKKTGTILGIYNLAGINCQGLDFIPTENRSWIIDSIINSKIIFDEEVRFSINIGEQSFELEIFKLFDMNAIK
ncbi:hypothetical protein [Psittacicella gerlachiana]|uniref:Aminomethyltransferase folate-binding domain-containing protein n=1 Tax=Psittacicella gerlachiana TaxID=2028574 RepID=A0A3A1YL92_9GAMM|nr:hypothetical protein [Psittacicella gerlachiana]RIY38922.1 hypothetical protein CKF59_00030 [Psittacicella gerlachiana]